MQLTHRRRPRPRREGWYQHPERGYTTAMTAFLLIPMMIFAGFAVDVGSWYTRAMEIQRAADAAALAGVVWLPGDFPQAEIEARAVASRNGFTNGVDNIQVLVQEVIGRPQELDVIITDTRVETMFGAVVKSHISLTRSARSRYVLPVPLGSPYNFFGNTPGKTLTPQPLLFPHISSPYTNHGDGDPMSTKCAGNGSSSALSCSGAANTEYRADGYLYVVDVPEEGVGRTLTVEIYDSTWDPGTVTEFAGDRWLGSGVTQRQPGLQYELFDTDGTPLDPTDNTSMVTAGKCTTGPGRFRYLNNDTSADNDWKTLCSFTVTTEGQYPLRVKSSAIPTTTDQGNGSNGYSLVATLSGAGLQPQLYAYGDMSIQTSLTGTASLYLAEVEPEHAGKTFRIELFDPGDGTGSNDYFLSIINPAGTTATCKYTNASGVMGTSGTCRIQTRSGSSNVYNDKWLTIEITLGTTYTCNSATATGCWWKMQYELTGTPTDRTTWRANVLGDPVQLIR